MGRKKKIPEDIDVVLYDINKLKTKESLVEYYNCTLSGLESYLKRKSIKLTRGKWIIKKRDQ